jgi:hypothetical protein
MFPGFPGFICFGELWVFGIIERCAPPYAPADRSLECVGAQEPVEWNRPGLLRRQVAGLFPGVPEILKLAVGQEGTVMFTMMFTMTIAWLLVPLLSRIGSK